jgi:hypothetical protein
MTRTRLVQWGALGSLVLLALWFRPDLPPAWAQGVGIFSRATCNESNLTGPVVGQTWCFDQTAQKLTVWNGSSFASVTLDNVATLTTIAGMTDYVNYALDVPPIGSSQQLGLYLHMQGSNTAAAANLYRIPLLILATTGGGAASATTDSVEGLNVTVAQGSADKAAQVVGAEISFDNDKADDTITPSLSHLGLTVDAYGHKTGPGALRISSGDSGAGQWWRGVWLPEGAIVDGGYAFVYDGNGKGPGCPGSCVSRVAIDADGIVTAASMNLANGNLSLTGGNNRILFAGTSSNMGDNTSLGLLTYVGGSNGYAFYDHTGTSATVTISNQGGVAIASPTGGNIARSLNVASATFLNGFASQVATPTGVNLMNVRSFSASSSASNNIRGTCTFSAAATCAVTFSTNEPDANYFVLVGGIVNVTSKARSGFTLQATTTNSNAVDWLLIR